MNWTSAQLKQYLLGTLPETEKERLEIELLKGNEILGEELEISESDLIEDYLDEQLTTGEIKAFEQLFLNSPARVKKIELLRALKTRAQAVAQTQSIAEADSKSNDESFLNKFKNHVSEKSRLRPVLVWSLIGALAALLILFVVVFRDTLPFAQSMLGEREIAEVNKRDLSDLNVFADFSQLNLVSGNFRSNDSVQSLTKGDLSETVVARLALPEGLESNEFQINLSRDGKAVVTLSNARAYANQHGREIRLLLPSSILSPANYKIEARPLNSKNQNDSLNYTFAVRP